MATQTKTRPQEKKALEVYCSACGKFGTHWKDEKDDTLLECENCNFSH